MRLVRRLMGGGLILATAFAVSLVAASCAKGTDNTDLGEGGPDEPDAERDVNVLPLEDSGGADTATKPVDDSGGACSGKVVINELKTDGVTASDEFVELYNAGNCAVPLTGWAVKYESAAGGPAPATGYTFIAGDSIAANAYFLIAASTFSGKKDATLNTGFAAASGQVGLVDDKGAVVDGVAYGTVTGGTYREKSAAPAPPTNKSIGRQPNGVDTDDNSADFKVLSAVSPGAAN